MGFGVVAIFAAGWIWGLGAKVLRRGPGEPYWTWLAVGITGVVLVILGASSERRRRAMDRYNQYR